MFLTSLDITYLLILFIPYKASSIDIMSFISGEWSPLRFRQSSFCTCMAEEVKIFQNVTNKFCFSRYTCNSLLLK